MTTELMIIIAAVSLVSTILGIIVNYRSLSKEREERGREMGAMTNELSNQKGALSRAFTEICKNADAIVPMQGTIAKMGAGIEYLIKTMDEIKEDMKKERRGNGDKS
jgi:hypothetical protein